ncbi:hypothetical protein JRO89_XS09G0162700 [Xanthoceras sorbifolium]|uniref:Disease resistance protein At4g27190-like leucine-rich repeats domain-containing protein n=1 Tax=Xanthoceras sorbifolium TaxID=99658 RepID=A0ABQ8HLL1_9ROSI|nr:hypothetical protein JRO89_XS09G0162700 [Xanthoceras sorbifolium]
MQHRVDEAIKQTEVIEKDMEKWLRDVSNVVTDFEDLEKETTSGKQTCLYGWCPNLIWKYKLARRAEKKTNIMLKLRDTGKFDNLEGLEQELSLPSLKVLELMNLNELECLWKGPTHLLSLQNLKMLRVIGCNRLRHMFSPTLPRNLLHLEVLIIKYCGELEQIIVGDHTVDHVQLGLFPNLYSISVTKCDKLKALFLISIARSDLQKLTSLTVETTFQLEELFRHEDEADMKRLVVNECPKITTRFSVDQNTSVHAEAEAPQTSKEDVDMEESPPEVTREIYGWFSNDIQNSLPPYIGK